MCKLTRDHCDLCGSETFSDGRFALGKLWCSECWSGRQPPKGIMPPTPAYRAQLDLWCAPRTGTPPKAQTPRTSSPVQPRAALSGRPAMSTRIGS